MSASRFITDLDAHEPHRHLTLEVTAEVSSGRGDGLDTDFTLCLRRGQDDEDLVAGTLKTIAQMEAVIEQLRALVAWAKAEKRFGDSPSH